MQACDFCVKKIDFNKNLFTLVRSVLFDITLKEKMIVIFSVSLNFTLANLCRGHWPRSQPATVPGILGSPNT